MVYPLDEALEMPVNLWSYNIQEIMAYGASESNFRDSIQVMNQLLGLNLQGMDAARNVVELSTLVEEYYTECSPPELSESTQCCCVSFDGKGVPKIKETRSKSTPPSSRLNKGQKRGVKQMATVVVSSCFMPKQRSKDSIINGLIIGMINKSQVQQRQMTRLIMPSKQTIRLRQMKTLIVGRRTFIVGHS